MKTRLIHISLIILLLFIGGCAASGKLERDPNAAKYPVDISSGKRDRQKAEALENDLVALNHGSDHINQTIL